MLEIDTATSGDPEGWAARHDAWHRTLETALEQEGDGLQAPGIADPGHHVGRTAVLRSLSALANKAGERGWRAAEEHLRVLVRRTARRYLEARDDNDRIPALLQLCVVAADALVRAGDTHAASAYIDLGLDCARSLSPRQADASTLSLAVLRGRLGAPGKTEVVLSNLLLWQIGSAASGEPSNSVNRGEIEKAARELAVLADNALTAEVLGVWIGFLTWFLLDWQRPGNERPITATDLLAALQGMIGYLYAVDNARIANLFKRFQRVRADIAASPRRHARTGSGMHRLQPVLKARRLIARFVPRADRLWRRWLPGMTVRDDYNRLRDVLRTWVTSSLLRQLGWHEDLTSESGTLLAVTYLTGEVDASWNQASAGRWLKQCPLKARDSDAQRALFDRLAESRDGKGAPIENWLDRFELRTRVAIENDLIFARAPELDDGFGALSNDDPADLHAMLDRAWCRALIDAEILERLERSLTDGGPYQGMRPPLDAHRRPPDPYGPCDPAEYLIQELFDWQHVSTSLATQAAVLLGALFTHEMRAQNGQPVDVISAWEATRPWADSAVSHDGLAALHQAWCERAEGPPIRAWLNTLGFSDALKLDPTWSMAASAPHIDQAFTAFGEGDLEPLQILLDQAWTDAQRVGEILARLSHGLAAGKANQPLPTDEDEPPTAIGARDGQIALSHAIQGHRAGFLHPAVLQHLALRAKQPSFIAALEARIAGRHSRKLYDAVADVLDARAAVTPESSLDEFDGGLARLWGAAAHLHPGRYRDDELMETMHAWSRAALQEAIDKDTLEGIWSALESGRYALSGLAVTPSDDIWESETARLLKSAMTRSANRSDEEDPARNAWPPLAAWVEQCTELRPEQASIAACRARLRPGEALVQPYFAPDSGDLEALWLTANAAPQRRSFPPTCREAIWNEQVLAPWSDWLDELKREPDLRMHRGSQHHDLPGAAAGEASWHEILAQEPIRSFADTLAGWAKIERIEQLNLMLPGPLAQLPWEALPDSPLSAEMLTRAVSLAQWRTRDDSTQPHARWTCYDAAWPCAASEARCVDANTSSNLEATSYDLLAALNDKDSIYLILNGRYARFDPHRGGLWLRDDQFAPLWLTTAIGVRAKLLVLNAGAGVLGGESTRGLLGPTGIAPTLVAGGARTLLGTLWPCHDLATLVFVAHLVGLGKEVDWRNRPLSHQVAEAKRRLKESTGNEVRDLVERHAAGKHAYLDPQVCQLYCDRARPFEDPRYWAPYVVFGEPTGALIR